jgi:hypothetical protein
MEQRYDAVMEVLRDGRMVVDVATRYWVSRQSVHNWISRYQQEGIEGLANGSSRPRSCPHQMPIEVKVVLVEMRLAHPRWGPRTPDPTGYALIANSGESDHLVACHRDGMSRKVTTIRMPREIADQVEAVARGRGVSVNAVVLEALASEIQRVKKDKVFMARLREITKRDKEILDRLAR